VSDNSIVYMSLALMKYSAIRSSLNSRMFVYVHDCYVIHLCSENETGLTMELKLVSINESRC